MDKQKLENLRHSLAHLLAAAVLELWPDAKRAIGPAIDNGFYYDFEFPTAPATEENLHEIEDRMKEILNTWRKFDREEISADDARKLFVDNPYKLEMINEYADQGLTLYKSGEYVDLCRGGHVDDAKDIKPDTFKLTHIAGAYWRGDEKNKMLTRIYGVAFETKKDLDDYLWMIEEAKKRDHRKLGKQLDLFTFSELIGSGLPLYTPRGAFIRRALTNYIEELQTKVGYTQVWTPQIAKAELFKISGHYDKYKDDMFRVVSNYSKEEFFLKPMNCPQHTQIYAGQPRSYRDLPLRYTDFAMLYRDEKPGELNGLARVRSFSQDDCHIFCREDQIDEEIDKALAMTKEAMATFGLKYRYRLSTRDPEHPEKYLGHPETWDKVEKWAEKIMKRNKIDYFDGPGEAAFYAPKMDLMATDALGREWQLSTVQIDFVMPERFDLTYIAEDGQKKHPIMIHRAIIGSPERFMMILLEHFAGALPLWLAPVQAMVLPISDKFTDYANKVAGQLKENNLRAEVDNRNESVGKKIRESEMQKAPYILVVGEKEVSTETVAVRKRGQGDLGQLKTEDFIKQLVKETQSKEI
jgi:threonyl-tRNA synthetase